MPPATDKIPLGYLPTYRWLAAGIGPAGRVCEIGVYHGASLELWQELFPQGLIVGVDHDQDAHWPDGTIRVVAEQTSADLPDQLAAYAPRFDLIVEDASHEGHRSRRTFELLWPLVAPGRWYVIEDWQAGFPNWNGNGAMQPSMLSMAEGLLWTLASRDGDVEQISYRYGMIILEKKPGA